uniref:Uncharacterized protein n=1 Tax=Acrobeloides nanus TaxID=290746 RepID=A0A914CIF3_9BILA
MIGRALDLAFRTEQFGALDLIAKDLDENSDPRVLERAAQFFSNNQQDRMAVQLLAYAKKYSEAVELCRSKNVIINEELAEVISPPKGDKASSVQRTKLLEEIARCCLQQGNYHFAAKKFTQAGNKLEAMRALLKSGDTPKIILYANTARNKDIYRLVGNYLQSLNWKEDVNLMRQIEAFYMKADALESLSAFYASCAQVEIDDYRDYEKGLAAYSEALRCISKKLDKENGLDGRSVDKMEELKETIDKIKRFIAAKQIYETDPGECMQKLQAMVEEPDMDESVRLGDIHSIIILHNVKRANFKKAWSIIEQCENRRPKVDMRQYLSRQILDQICDEVGVLRITRPMSVEEDFGDEENGVDYSHAMQRRINKVDMDDED